MQALKKDTWQVYSQLILKIGRDLYVDIGRACLLVLLLAARVCSLDSLATFSFTDLVCCVMEKKDSLQHKGVKIYE